MAAGRFRCAALALALAFASFVGQAAGNLGAAGLRSHYNVISPALAQSAFGGPMVLQSEESKRRIEGEVYAVLDHPFPVVAQALGDPGRWCDILILHLNTKFCHKGGEHGATVVDLRVGRKEPQAIERASLLSFVWRPQQQQPDYLAVQMDAPDGPYDTRDYRLQVEAVPIEGNRTFLHMGYAFSYGGTSSIAMSLYLNTVGRDKVGFTREHGATATDEGLVGGMRGVAERNTMRYYLAIDAYLASLSAPAQQQLEKRLTAWFDGTERYARQLHEVDRDAYLRMKRAEVQRQLAVR